MYRSEKLYLTIDNIIPDSEVYPICIPSYNRPEAKLLKELKRNGNGLRVILFVRKEQYELYSQYSDVFKIVKLKM